jgi:hypothetical protein
MATHKQKQIQSELARTVAERWNALHGEGTRVEYQGHPEAPARVTRTESIAFVRGGVDVRICLADVAGTVPLTACRPVEATAAAELAAATGQPNTTPARERLRDRLTALIVEHDVLRQHLRRCLAALAENRPLTEFALEIKAAAREHDEFASLLADLHVTTDPNPE